jgi:hypothetical protein
MAKRAASAWAFGVTVFPSASCRPNSTNRGSASTSVKPSDARSPNTWSNVRFSRTTITTCLIGLWPACAWSGMGLSAGLEAFACAPNHSRSIACCRPFVTESSVGAATRLSSPTMSLPSYCVCLVTGTPP